MDIVNKLQSRHDELEQRKFFTVLPVYKEAIEEIRRLQDEQRTSEWVPINDTFDKWDEWLLFWDGVAKEYDCVISQEDLKDQRYTHYWSTPEPPKGDE